MIALLKKTFSEFSEDNCSRMAAALAYYTVFSLAPLLMLIILIAGFVWDPEAIRGTLEQEIQTVVGKDGAEQVKTMLEHAGSSDRGTMATILSTAMLLVGATGLVNQLQSAMNDAWEVKPDPETSGIGNFLMKRVFSFAMICAIAFLLLVSLVLSSMLSAAGGTIASMLPSAVSGTVLHALNIGVALIIISALFAVMFKYLPDAEIRWSDVGIGALLTGVLFVAGKYAIGAYLGSKNMESTYGAAGSLALILIWIYYSAMIFLLGVEFTQIWARQRGSGLVPAEGAVHVQQKIERRSEMKQHTV